MVFRGLLILAVLHLAAVAATAVEEPVSVQVAHLDGESAIVVRGISLKTLARLPQDEERSAERSTLLRVYVGEDASKDLPPVLGTVKTIDDQLVFLPRFPLQPGLAYRVLLARQLLPLESNEDDAPELVEQIVRVAEEEGGEPPAVSAVYPSGDVLPENLLKFYIHFSAPMSQGNVYDCVRLVDEAGKSIDYPFVNVGQELWDRSGTRITLLMDPGRIKRGLRPREELGPILYEGRRYEFVIDGAWRDARGNPLGEDFRKAFRVVAPDDVQPDPAKWQIESPAAGTTSPLSITFAEPLDHAMLFSSFSVFDEHQREIAGRIQVDDEETSWQFVPDAAWTAGDYALVVEAALEDRAGNSIEKPFEVDVFDRVDARVVEKSVSLPFRVGE